MPPELILKLLAETPLTNIAELRHEAIALIEALQARVAELEAEAKKYLTTIGEMAFAHVAAMDKRDANAPQSRACSSRSCLPGPRRAIQSHHWMGCEELDESTNSRSSLDLYTRRTVTMPRFRASQRSQGTLVHRTMKLVVGCGR